MTDLDHIVHDYIALEQRVQQIMNQICAPFCAACQNCCCRYDICEESLEAPFLCLLRKEIPAHDELCASYGWLTHAGCALTVGRPPVCYEFLCDDLMGSLPDDHIRYALRTLGMIITYVGENALGHTHLVEIINEGDLEKVKYDRIKKRMFHAQQALQDIKGLIEQNVTAPPTSAMLRICTPDTELFQGP